MSLRTKAILVLAAAMLAISGCSLGLDEAPAFVSSFAAKAIADEIVDDAVEAAEAAGTDPASVSLIGKVVADNLGDLDPEDHDIPVVTGIADEDGDGLDDDRSFQLDVGDQVVCANIDAAASDTVAGSGC